LMHGNCEALVKGCRICVANPLTASHLTGRKIWQASQHLTVSSDYEKVELQLNYKNYASPS